MRNYIAASGHLMTTTTSHESRDGSTTPDYWNAAHSALCPCLTSEDW